MKMACNAFRRVLSRSFLGLLLVFLVTLPVRASVVVSGSNGANGTYNTFALALSAINGKASNQYGYDIVVAIQSGETLSTSTSWSLNQGNWNSLLIYPTATCVMRTASTAAVMNLNGADNVTIDGRLNGTGDPALTFSCSVGGSALRFLATGTFSDVGATNNTVRYCTLTAANATNAIVYFSGRNNTGNTVDACTITNYNGTRSTRAIYNSGSGSTGNTISNNVIYDTWITGATTSYSIQVTGAASGWTISGNSIFDGGLSALNANTRTYYPIYVSDASATNLQVSGNYIGGSAPQCGGGAMSVSFGSSARNTTLIPIYISASTSTIQSNTIGNLWFFSSLTGGFSGIQVVAGNADVLDNVFNGLIVKTSTAGSVTYGIRLSSGTSATWNVLRNHFTNVELTSSNTARDNDFYAIYKAASSGTLTISNNEIGSASIANDVQCSSTSTGASQLMYGIYSDCTGTVTISDNTLQNLTNAATGTYAGTLTAIRVGGGTNTITGNTISDLTSSNATTGTAPSSVAGVFVTGTSTYSDVSLNTIYNLSNSATSGYVMGINFAGATSGTNPIRRNFLRNITGGGSAAYGIGIYKASGSSTISNNVLLMSATPDATLAGVWDAGGSPTNVYHNTIYLSGTATMASSYCLRSDGTNTRDYRNNIFANTRTGTDGNSYHYGVYYSATDPNSMTCDYNVFRITGGTHGSVAYYGGGRLTLSAYQSNSGKESNSVEDDPLFVNAGSSTASDYNVQKQLIGDATVAVTTDYAGANREAYTAGAWEYVSVELWSNGTFRSKYGSLKGAFDKINDGTWTGDIAIKLNGNTRESASAVLNRSGSGSANYTRLTVYPQTAGVVILGNLNAPVIDLNGADNVTINGSVYLNNTTTSMVIRNTYAGASASAVRFRESAENNALKFCELDACPASSSNGVILFSTSSLGSGNRYDTIQNCSISGVGDAAANRPYNAIYSSGTSGRENASVVILNNAFHDFFRPTVAVGDSSAGILIGANSTAFTIQGNSFYESNTFTTTAATPYRVIDVNNPSGSSYTIQGNFIGGNAPQCAGTWVKTGSNNPFAAIRLWVGADTRSVVQGNLINGFNYTNSAGADWSGIRVESGTVDVGVGGANTLGNATGNGGILVKNTATGGSLYGIWVGATDSVTCSNNVVAGITTQTTNTTYALSLYGIYKNAGAGICRFEGNTVGGTTTENSLLTQSTSTGYAQHLVGIYAAGTEQNYVVNNTICHLTNLTTAPNSIVAMTRGILTLAGSNTIDNNYVHHLSTLSAQSGNFENSTLIGIAQLSQQVNTTQRVRSNIVYNLKNTTTATVEMYGILYEGPSTGENEVSRNFFSTFVIVSTDAAYLHGLSLYTGAYTASNNIVFIGENITTGCSIWGMFNQSPYSVKIYHNTVYLSGTALTGTSNTFAFRDRTDSPTDRMVYNNIFWNARHNNVTTISHYAVYYQNTANSQMDNNDFQFWENFARTSSAEYASLAAWKSAFPAFDQHSLNIDPMLTNLGGLSPTDYQPSVGTLLGAPLPAVPVDFGYVQRSATQPTMGAWEYIANPVEVWNGTTFRQSYPTLKTAFDAINQGLWTGDLTVKVRSNVKETASAVLYQTGYTGAGGISSYSRVHIYPTREEVKVYGTLAAPLVTLNGASGVVFDGRVNGTGATGNLILENQNLSTSASTVQFINSAQGDSLTYCTLKGLTQNASGGIVHFATSSTGTGNDDNCLLGNKITTVTTDPSVKSRVINAVYSQGTASRENSGNSFIDNQIYDVWDQKASSNGIHVGANSTGFTLQGNSVYETTTFTPAGAYTYQGIRIDNTSGVGFNLINNTIGGSALLAQGAPLTMGTTTSANTCVFQPLYLNVGTSEATSVQGNSIRNIAFTSPNTAPFYAVYIQAGTVNVGTTVGNTIGASTGFGSIVVTGASAASTSYGIYANSTSAIRIENNVIGALYTKTTAVAAAHSLMAICKPAGIAGDLTVRNNLLGSLSTVGSLRAASVSTGNAQSVYGIYFSGTGVFTAEANTVANAMDSTTNATSGDLVGIYFNQSTSASNLIDRNFIYGLSLQPTASTASNTLAGIRLAGGTVRTQNNIVWVGEGVPGNFYIYGVLDAGATGTHFIYHNTVYLTGAASSATYTKRSAAYERSNNLGTLDLSNNILYNARTGGTNMHYAAYLAGTTGLTINGNDYVTSGGWFLCYTPSTNVTDLPWWKSLFANDTKSVNVLPFDAPSSAVATYFRPTSDLQGNGGVGTTSDYSQSPRNTSQPTMGAWERVNKWKGSVSIDFNTPSNWTFGMVPSAYDNVIFDDAPLRPCTMDQNRYIKNILNAQPTYRLLVNGYTLYLSGAMLFTNGAQVDASPVSSGVEFTGSAVQEIPSGAFKDNTIYNLTVNNPNNVVLHGTVMIANALTATSGKLDATASDATLGYSGTSAQVIASNTLVANKATNLMVTNPVGLTLNTELTVSNNLTVASGAKLILPEGIRLTVDGTLSNASGTSGLLLKSSALGTASLMHTTPGVQATVQRYIDGDADAWHFLSAPVSDQVIVSSPLTGWTPSGSHGDGTGYDLYVWDEASSCWVYNLNTTVATTWTTAHPQTNFVPGRGYLYALQELHPTKQFAGTLNVGTISRPVTKVSTIDTLTGFNFLGNPYPSSIDWRINSGYGRSMLEQNAGGYWIWVWSAINNNYGVYNSADVDSIGTNNVTSHISPMQGFFVRAAGSGAFTFTNAARSHYEANSWLRSASALEDASSISNLRLAVKSEWGGDEVKLGVGSSADEAGALKMFSPVAEAPSLYLNVGGSSYSTRRMVSASEPRYQPICFEAGKSGAFTLQCALDPAMGKVYLEDRKTGSVLDLTQVTMYAFDASPSDAPTRFVLHFGAVTKVDEAIHPNVWLESGSVSVWLERMVGNYTVSVYDVFGRAISQQKLSGGERCSVGLFGRGTYLVKVSDGDNEKTVKIIY
jgi:hypothetical protein